MNSYLFSPSKIIEKLYLGNCEDAKNLEALKELGIKYILIAGNNLDVHFPKVKK